MIYQIEYSDTARIELLEAYLWLKERTPFHAEPWREGIIKAVESLESFPERCPIAPDNDLFEEEIRQLLYGKKHRTFRILFTIRNQSVYILHIRHGSRFYYNFEEEL